MKKIHKTKIKDLGFRASDKISKFVGTWTFIFLYTLSMLLWIVLHLLKVLHIDGPDFIKWNLWLSYFAGTQASIVLMSSARQADIDRQKQELGLKLDENTYKISKSTNDKIADLTKNVEMLESIIEEMISDTENRIKDQNNDV